MAKCIWWCNSQDLTSKQKKEKDGWVEPVRVTLDKQLERGTLNAGINEF